MRDAILRILLLLCLLGPAACQDDAAKVEEHMSRGQAYVEEEKIKEAIIEFKSAVQIDPNDAQAHFALAHAFLRDEKPKEGYWELRETVRLDPSNHQAKLEFSQIAIVAGEQEEALKQASSVVEADPSNVRAHVVKGQALDALDRRDEAREAYRAALEVDPEDESALRALAASEVRRENDAEAEALLKQLIELHPSYPNYTLMARFLSRFGPDRAEEREAYFKKGVALANADERAAAYSMLVAYYVRQDRVDDAFELLEQAIASSDDPVDLIYLLARLHRSQGNLERADELVYQATEARPDDPRVHGVLAAYRARNGDYDGALLASEKALALDPSDRLLRLQRAEILMQLGFRDDKDELVEESRSVVGEVLAEEPTNPDALIVDARLKMASNQPEEAMAEMRAAIDAKPDHAQAHYLLGLALASQNDHAGARVELGRALEIDSGLLEAKFALAQVHSRLGEWEYAVERCREYLRERPDQHAARLLLAQSLARLKRFDEAQAEIDRIPEEERGGEVFFALGRLAQAQGDSDKAREQLLAANQALPGNWEVLQALLFADRAQGRFAESKQRIEEALAADPQNAKLQQLAGTVAFLEGRNQDAETYFQKAVELDPEDLQGYERLARFYAASGRLEETTKTYENALSVRPEEPQLHHFLGVLYELSGDRERAIARYEDAIRYGPNLAEAKNNLAYLYADSGQNLDRALDLAQDAKGLLPNNASVADTLGWVLHKRGVPAAAISYLKEAEAATEPTDASIGVVRFHLAQAYEASGEHQLALEALERSLEGLESQMEAARARGLNPGPEPVWAAEAREMQERLTAAQTAAG